MLTTDTSGQASFSNLDIVCGMSWSRLDQLVKTKRSAGDDLLVKKIKLDE